MGDNAPVTPDKDPGGTPQEDAFLPGEIGQDEGQAASSCDGLTEGESRPCYGGEAGTEHHGVCMVGMVTCRNGHLGGCQGEIVPVTEVCGDGLDNDCDGEIEDGCPCDGTADLKFPCYSGTRKTLGVGLCKTGYMECLASGTFGPCMDDILPAADECDGLDNDCNGIVDDNSPAVGEACDTGMHGVCNVGVTACKQGDVICVQVAEASQEECDELDNDCDGEVDEGSTGDGTDCLTGLVGICQMGILTCVRGEMICVQKEDVDTEVCDGRDNDCNGQTDEGFCKIGFGATSTVATCVPTGSLNPSNACEECIPATSATAYTTVTTHICTDNNACTKQDSCATGTCVGTAYACLECETCDGAGGCTLNAGFCKIGEACVAEGALHPENKCRECIPATSVGEYAIDDTNACSDNNVCTVGDACLDGQCKADPRFVCAGTACPEDTCMALIEEEKMFLGMPMEVGGSEGVRVHIPVMALFNHSDATPEDLLVDAIIRTDSAFPAGTTLTVTCNGVPVGDPYVSDGVATQAWQSAILGISRTPLWAGTDAAWGIAIDGLPGDTTYVVDIFAVTALDATFGDSLDIPEAGESDRYLLAQASTLLSVLKTDAYCALAENNGKPCSDDDTCTTSDRCDGGQCVGTEHASCLACETCDGQGGCMLNAGFCRINDACVAEGVVDPDNGCAECMPLTDAFDYVTDTTNTCSDGISCTTDSCATGTCVGTGMTYTPQGVATPYNVYSQADVDLLNNGCYTELAASMRIVGTSLTSINFPILKTIRGQLFVEGNGSLTTIAMPSLEMLGGQVFFNFNNSLKTIALSKVRQAENVVVINNNSLESLTMNALTALTGKMQIASNPELTTIAMDLLSTIGGELSIINNVLLQVLSLVKEPGSTVGLTSVGMPDVWIHSCPALPCALQVCPLKTQLVDKTYVWHLDAGCCP